jgi:hypothetical protein
MRGSHESPTFGESVRQAVKGTWPVILAPFAGIALAAWHTGGSGTWVLALVASTVGATSLVLGLYGWHRSKR